MMTFPPHLPCADPEFKRHTASSTSFAEASAIHALGLPELQAQTNFFFFLNNPSWVDLLSNKRNQAKHLTVLKVLHLLEVSRRRATFDSNTSQRFRQRTQEGGSIVLAQHPETLHSPRLRFPISKVEAGPVRWLRVFATKTDNLSLVPRVHVKEVVL